jgi:hypothetical protein
MELSERNQKECGLLIVISQAMNIEKKGDRERGNEQKKSHIRPQYPSFSLTTTLSSRSSRLPCKPINPNETRTTIGMKMKGRKEGKKGREGKRGEERESSLRKVTVTDRQRDTDTDRL